MVIYGYGRGSTQQQITTLLKQEEMCLAYWDLCFKIGKTDKQFGGFYVDKATSGKIPLFERSGASDMFSVMKPGDMVVISEKDRAFRSCLDACRTLDLLLERDLMMHMLDCPFDLTTDTGRCFLQVFASFAELDRKNIGRRTSEAKQYKIRQGLPTGAAPYVGWKVVGKKDKARFVPDNERRRVGEYIAKLRDENLMSFEKIADFLNKQRVRNSQGNRWNRERANKTYWSCKAGWPKIKTTEMDEMKRLAAINASS